MFWSIKKRSNVNHISCRSSPVGGVGTTVLFYAMGIGSKVLISDVLMNVTDSSSTSIRNMILVGQLTVGIHNFLKCSVSFKR